MHPILDRLGDFTPFFEKKVVNAPKFGTFGCFLKMKFKKEIHFFRPTDPNIQKFYLRATQNFLFFAL